MASATIASRAASHRSALANSWVDTAAPFTAPPSQLTTIRTWVIIGLDGPAERKPGAPDARVQLRRLYVETREASVELIEADSLGEAGTKLADKLREARLV